MLLSATDTFNAILYKVPKTVPLSTNLALTATATDELAVILFLQIQQKSINQQKWIELCCGKTLSPILNTSALMIILSQSYFPF